MIRVPCAALAQKQVGKYLLLFLDEQNGFIYNLPPTVIINQITS